MQQEVGWKKESRTGSSPADSVREKGEEKPLSEVSCNLIKHHSPIFFPTSFRNICTVFCHSQSHDEWFKFALHFTVVGVDCDFKVKKKNNEFLILLCSKLPKDRYATKHPSCLLHTSDYSRGYQNHKFPLRLDDPSSELVKKLKNCAHTNWGFSAAVWIPRGFLTQVSTCSYHMHQKLLYMLSNLDISTHSLYSFCKIHKGCTGTPKSTAHTSRPTLLKVWFPQNCQTCDTCNNSEKLI